MLLYSNTFLQLWIDPHLMKPFQWLPIVQFFCVVI